MQTIDRRIRFVFKRSLFNPFSTHLTTAPDQGVFKTPAYIPIAQEMTKKIAEQTGMLPQNTINEVLLNIPLTAHILGGCNIGATPEEGVIDKNQKLFGYEGIYICDGSAISANLGVNPSLTITAMSERVMSHIPNK